MIIVENDEDERFFMKESFDATGLFDIIALLENGDALFKYLEVHATNLPDVILSDLNMPGKNGYDIIVDVKHNPVYAHIPVLITSTSPAKSIITKCLALGAADYILKPDTFVEYGPYAKQLHALIEAKQLVR